MNDFDPNEKRALQSKLARLQSYVLEQQFEVARTDEIANEDGIFFRQRLIAAIKDSFSDDADNEIDDANDDDIFGDADNDDEW